MDSDLEDAISESEFRRQIDQDELLHDLARSDDEDVQMPDSSLAGSRSPSPNHSPVSVASYGVVDDNDEEQLHPNTQRSVVRSQRQGSASSVASTTVELSRIQRRALEAHKKGVLALAKHLLRRDENDPITNKVPKSGTQAFCHDRGLPHNYILMLLSFSEDYITNVICGNQEAFFTSNENPPTPPARSAKPDTDEPLGIIYGNFLSGPDGEKPTIHNLEGIAHYYEKYIEGLVVVNPGQEEKAYVHRVSQHKTTAVMVFKIDRLERKLRDKVKQKERHNRVNATMAIGNMNIAAMFQVAQPPAPAAGPISVSSDDDSNVNSGDDSEDESTASSTWSAGALSTSEESLLVLKKSRRNFVTSPSKLDHAQEWLQCLKDIIEDAKNRGLKRDDTIDRCICDIGWTWYAPKRRYDHENFNGSIEHMNLVSAICRVYFPTTDLSVRFRNLKVVLQEEAARYDEHTMTRLHMAYISEQGFNTARAGMSTDARKKITAAIFNAEADEIARKEVFIDRFNAEMKRLDEDLDEHKLIKDIETIRIENESGQLEVAEIGGKVEGCVKELHNVEDELHEQWDVALETFGEVHPVLEHGKHVIASLGLKLRTLMDDLVDMCEGLPDDDSVDEESSSDDESSSGSQVL